MKIVHLNWEGLISDIEYSVKKHHIGEQEEDIIQSVINTVTRRIGRGEV